MHDYTPLRVAAVKRETADAICVTLEVPEDDRATFAFTPGQHVPVRATLEGKEERRTYSICSDPGEPALRIAIKRLEGGLFSTWANMRLAPGMMIDVMPPQGRFVLPAGDGKPRDLLAIAAGAGITPIIAIVRHALATEPTARVTLVYGNRTMESTLFADELDDLKDRYLDRFTLLHVLSRSDNADTPILAGRVDAAKIRALLERLMPASDIAHAFLCGPSAMIKEARDTLTALGVPPRQIHHELFSAGPTAPQGLTRPASPRTAAPHGSVTDIIATLEGIRHRFQARDGEPVLDAALRAGIRAPYSCKGGMCCTCRAKVVDGSAVMRVNYSLEPWETEQGFVLTCQALAQGERLVIDYDQM